MIPEKNREARDKVLVLLRAQARRRELARNPVSVSYAEAPTDTTGFVKLVSDLQGSDAEAAADQLGATASELEYHAFIADLAEGEYSPQFIQFMHSKIDMEYFATKYLQRHFNRLFVNPLNGKKSPFHPNFHTDIVHILKRVGERKIITPVVIAGFPESGKTTLCSLLFPLHCICHGAFGIRSDGVIVDKTKRYHLFVSAVDENAKSLMKAVLEELEKNEEITNFYGHLYDDPNSGKRDAKEWNVRKATTTNGVHLEARSRRSKFRTLKWGPYRPDLGICDDIETDEGVKSEAERVKMDRFFFNVFVPRFSKDRGNIIILGNLIDERSLMSRLVKHGNNEGWITRVYRLFETDESGEKIYLIPDHYGAEYEAEKKKQLMGDDVIFQQEYLQRTDAGDAELSVDDFVYMKEGEYHERLSYSTIYLAVDPAASSSDRADPTAIGGIAFDEETGISRVLPMYINKIDISEQIQQIVSHYIHYQPHRLGIESVGFQKVLKPLVESYCMEHGFSIPVEEIKQDTKVHKMTRLRRLFPSIQNGTLRFTLNDPNHYILIQQLIAISKGVEPEFDDAADCLEMAVRMKDLEMMGELGDTTGSCNVVIGQFSERKIEVVEEARSSNLFTFDSKTYKQEDMDDDPRGNERYRDVMEARKALAR